MFCILIQDLVNEITSTRPLSLAVKA